MHAAIAVVARVVVAVLGAAALVHILLHLPWLLLLMLEVPLRVLVVEVRVGLLGVVRRVYA